ncbi:MAG: hypothetical protein HZB16_15350 [Armatimonadetes bacterium]|nr:hypothetical protein [Armatimonadota bacterium]
MTVVYRMRVLNWSADTTLFRHLTDQMLQDAYDEARGIGFQIDHRSDALVLGRFIMRRQFTDVVVTPTGTEVPYERVEYETTGFLAAPGPLGLCLTNPPRSTSIFTMRLAGFASDRLGVEQADVRLGELKERLESTLGPAAVRSVRLSGVALDDQVTATVVACGQRNVVDNAIRWVGDRAYCLDRINLAFDCRGEPLRIHAASSGAVGFSRWPSSETQTAVWTAIRDSSHS